MSFSLPRGKKENSKLCNMFQSKSTKSDENVKSSDFHMDPKSQALLKGSWPPGSSLTCSKAGWDPCSNQLCLPNCTPGLGATLSCSVIFHSPTSNRFW